VDAGRSYTPVVTPVHHRVGYTYEDAEDLDEVFAGASDNPVDMPPEIRAI